MIITREDETTIIDGAGARIRSRGGSTRFGTRSRSLTRDYDREKLQERLAKLAGGVAVIRRRSHRGRSSGERKHRVDWWTPSGNAQAARRGGHRNRWWRRQRLHRPAPRRSKDLQLEGRRGAVGARIVRRIALEGAAG